MTKYSFDAVIFDLDGVITKTALVHAGAWKAAFDEYMRLREGRDGEPFREFTHEDDYLPYVDGKPRYEGVKSFLESRNILISHGDPSDSPDKETICGIGNRKNLKFNDVLKEQGAEVFDSTVNFIRELKKSGIRVGVASSSKNCKAILESAGLQDLFETRVDGVVSAELGLKGKPEPDIFVMAARNVGAVPGRSVVVEDAVSGVQAGRNGGFGLVLGVAREKNGEELLESGADLAVCDLSAIDIPRIESWFKHKPKYLFSAWDEGSKRSHMPKGISRHNGVIVNPRYNRSADKLLSPAQRLIFFLDYDGTLTPIVKRPELAVLSPDMRSVIQRVSQEHTVAVVSGRMRRDVERLVGIKGIFYAGSHGFDISGPGVSLIQPQAEEAIPVIFEVTKRLKKNLRNAKGVLIEEKIFSVAVHYRLADTKDIPRIRENVNNMVNENDKLRLMSGKKVFEILPNIIWNKGTAVRWIVEVLGYSWHDSSVLYIGDDVTDEDAFRTVKSRGTGILVSSKAKPSSAYFYLLSPVDVKKLFERIFTEAQE